jgi:hypothetical protein
MIMNVRWVRIWKKSIVMCILSFIMNSFKSCVLNDYIKSTIPEPVD